MRLITALNAYEAACIRLVVYAMELRVAEVKLLEQRLSRQHRLSASPLLLSPCSSPPPILLETPTRCRFPSFFMGGENAPLVQIPEKV